MSRLPSRIRHLLIAAIVLECVALGAIQIRRWIGKDSKVRDASGVTVPDTTSHAAPSPSVRSSSSRAEPPRTPASIGAGPVSADGRAGPERVGLMGAGADDDQRRIASHSAAPSADDPGNSPASGRGDGTGRSAGVDSGTTPATVPQVSVPGMDAGQPVAPGVPSDGGSMRSSGPGSTVGGSVSPSMPPAMPGMPVVPPDADSSGDRKPEKDAPPDPDASDDEDSGEDESEADSTPPVLESLRFDPAQVEGGGVTTLTVQASDARSGLKSIWGEVRSPNRSAVLGFGSASVGPGPVFAFPLALPRSAQTGTWYVAWISLTDGAANTKLIQAPSVAAAPPGGTFAASSAESDDRPPEILQVWFEKTAVAPGERTVITVEARDDLSGVASVTGACQSPSKSALVWFNGALHADSGTWVGDVVIPKTADCGEWVVQQLAVKDTAGNTTLLHSDAPVLGRAGFRVSSGSDCDFTSPTLHAFDLSPVVVLSGTATEILVTAKIYDVGSGAATMSGWFEGPVAAGEARKISFTCSADPRDPDAPWTGRIQVPQLAARGTWKVGAIRLEDKAKNSRTYTSADPVVSGHVFQVQ